MKRYGFGICMLCCTVVLGYDNTYWELNKINQNLNGINRNFERLNNTLEQQRRDQKELQDEIIEQLEMEAHQRQFYARLYEAHPDVKQILGSIEFEYFLDKKINPMSSILTEKRKIKKVFNPFISRGERIVYQSPDMAIMLLDEFKVRQKQDLLIIERLLKVHPDAPQIFGSEEYKKWIQSKPPVFDPKEKTLEERLNDEVKQLNEFKTYLQGKIFYRTLYKAHPDVQKIVKTRQFHEWFAKEYNGQSLETVFRPFSPKGNPQMVENAIFCLNKYKDFQNKGSTQPGTANNK